MFKPKTNKSVLLAQMRADGRAAIRRKKAAALLWERSKSRSENPDRLKGVFRLWSEGLTAWGVYFIQAGDNGPVKIGVARDIRKRRGDLQMAHYQDLHIRGYISEQRNTTIAERTLHRHFARHRIRGEWFAPVEEITSLWKDEPCH